MQSPEVTRRIVTLKEPVGVCAAIAPWKFPAAMKITLIGSTDAEVDANAVAKVEEHVSC